MRSSICKVYYAPINNPQIAPAIEKQGLVKAAAENQQALENNQQAFEKQKQYLKDNKPFDFQEFAQMFLLGFQNYSKAQALEIQPLITAYKSNLVAQSQNASGMQKAQAMGAISQVNMLEFQISSVVNPPAPS